ncbi:DUF58 domain-containing protein [Microbacterium sp. P5_E9]
MKRLWPFTARGTGGLLLALGCFIAASELGVTVLMYFGLLLLALLVAGLVSLHLTRRTDNVTRSLYPEVVTVGRSATVTAHVGIRSPVPTAPGTWEDTLPKGLDGRPHGVFPALGSALRRADWSVDIEYPVTGLRRGIHPTGPLIVTSTDPFGLVRRRTVFTDRTAVTVAPAIVDLSALTDMLGNTGGTLHTENNQLGQGADNLIARLYLPGDSMRRIHWRASAHRGELMVRQEEQETTPEAVVVLDRSARRWAAEAMGSTGADPGFESAVTTCVSAVARLVVDGYSVDVIDSDGTVLADRIEGGDLSGVEDLRTHFATVTARREDHLPQLARLFNGVTTGPLVLIVGRLDSADAETLAPLVHHCTLPLLFAVAPERAAADLAAEFGWRVATIGPDDELRAAWTGTVDRGVSSGHR